MRIGLYGMPTAGKSYILDKIDFIDVIMGSKMLHMSDLDFDSHDKSGRENARKQLAQTLMQKQSFIMDGHYAFGNEIAFTEDDGKMYDAILYLHIDPNILRERMTGSKRNRKYLEYDIAEWQLREIEGLREYCHRNDKDFYVVDNPPKNYFEDTTVVIDFIRAVVDGYSCISYARRCVKDILEKSQSETVLLLDGDRTLTIEDTSSKIFGYKTHLYDGNFYTGYQAWRQNNEFFQYEFEDLSEIPVQLNEKVKMALTRDSYILTSGHMRAWGFISKELGLDYYFGAEMSAETKYFITKGLQAAGKRVVTYGDGMNDYYMMKQADMGFLVTKQDGTISRSLKGRDVEGLNLV